MREDEARTPGTHPGPRVGSAIPVPAVAAVTVGLAVAIAAWFGGRALSDDDVRRRLVIATGSESGTYHAVGTAVGRLLEEHGVVRSVEVLPTEGSVANLRRLAGEDGGADLAFAQSDTPASGHARLVATLYDELLHVLVRRDVAGEITDITDLTGRRVALGAIGSGTRQVAEHILEHFRVVPDETLDWGPEEAAAGLAAGTVDVAFLLTAVPSGLVTELAETDAVRFLSLGDGAAPGGEADALALVNARLAASTLPKATYVRLPERPVRTVAVAALLLARRDLDVAVVRDVTAEIFAHRLDLTTSDGGEIPVVARLREAYAPAVAVLPYHDGAVAYYERDAPSFFVEYAEAISLGLTLLVGAWSASVALRQWMRRRMKNRVDAYLLEVDQSTDDLRRLGLEELLTRRDALDDIRHRAFADFVAERLPADESFAILQNHLRGESAALEARILEKSTG